MHCSKPFSAGGDITHAFQQSRTVGDGVYILQNMNHSINAHKNYNYQFHATNNAQLQTYNLFFFFNDPATPEISPLPLPAAFPISFCRAPSAVSPTNGIPPSDAM